MFSSMIENWHGGVHGTLPNAQELPNAHRAITALQLHMMADAGALAWAAAVRHVLVAMLLSWATLCTCMHTRSGYELL